MVWGLKKPQLRPVLPLLMVGMADQSCNPSPAFLITWIGSHVAVVAHSPVRSTRLDCHYSQQLQATVDSYSGGLRGVGGTLNQLPLFSIYRGYIFESCICVLKCYNYSSNLIFMFGWSGLHHVLRMTHLERAPTMRITVC